MITWQDAWQDALYGEEGFYRQPAGPAGHFATSTHPPLGPVFAEAIAALADREGVCRVVDIGCGRGELLRCLHAARPDLTLTGVDVVPRPEGLPEGITWLQSPRTALLPLELADLRDVLVLAHEWLDVIPCPVLELDDTGTLREVLVDPDTGREELAPGAVDPSHLQWCATHWPSEGLAAGDRVEIGATRDAAWCDLRERITTGTLLAVDYGHTRTTRPREGTLTAYARGGPTVPIPDGSCDVTAHVAMDALPEASIATQREWLHRLLPDTVTPDHDLARTDPAAYLRGLARRGVVAQLCDPAGLGGFLWAISRRGPD